MTKLPTAVMKDDLVVELNCVRLLAPSNIYPCAQNISGSVMTSLLFPVSKQWNVSRGCLFV